MTTTAMLDERYGRRRSPRRRWIAGILVALVVVGVGAYAWMTYADAADSMTPQTTGFDIQDDAVTLSFQVTVPAGRDMACILEAQDEEHGIVGWKVVEYPSTDEHTRAFTESIPTVAAATTGLVNSCWVT